MARTINEDGEVKFVDSKGNIKWFSVVMANNTKLMKEKGFTEFEAPIKLLPKELNPEPTGETSQDEKQNEVANPTQTIETKKEKRKRNNKKQINKKNLCQ